MEYGLIGEKLSHSYSPQIHKAFADYEYKLNAISADELDEFMKAKDFKGINVTIPYKQTVMPYLDEISEEAKKIGAVNTIINKNGKLYGYNTDYYGFSYLAKVANISFDGKKVIILGSGGAAKAVYAVVKDEGAVNIKTISRTGEYNYSNVYNLFETQIIINATPIGMFPDFDNQPINLEHFPKLEGVIDLIYNPLSTSLILNAKKLKINCIGGLNMLIAQGAKAAELFTDSSIAPEKIDETVNVMNKKLTNIVLIGMPGSGKSSIARELAKLLDMPYFDLDNELEKKYLKTIKEIFSAKGEAHFRELEIELVKEFSEKTGIIISTGGGVVVNDINIERLKKNGRIYFIDRNINLLATKGRPLSKDKDSVFKLYLARIEKYRAASDCTVRNNQQFNKAVETIIEDYKLI